MHNYLYMVEIAKPAEWRLQRLLGFAKDEETKTRFREHLTPMLGSEKMFERIKSALELVGARGFIYGFMVSAHGEWFERKSKNPTRSMRTYLGKIEAVRPIVNVLTAKAKKAGLTARLGLNPFVLTERFPTLKFRDSKGDVFWASFEPRGKTVTVKYIQGLGSRRHDGTVDQAIKRRVEQAIGAMGYKRLRDGLFEDICTASHGKFGKVEYLHPSHDKHYKGSGGEFYALARRKKLVKTPTRAIRHLKAA